MCQIGNQHHHVLVALKISLVGLPANKPRDLPAFSHHRCTSRAFPGDHDQWWWREWWCWWLSWEILNCDHVNDDDVEISPTEKISRKGPWSYHQHHHHHPHHSHQVDLWKGVIVVPPTHSVKGFKVAAPVNTFDHLEKIWTTLTTLTTHLDHLPDHRPVWDDQPLLAAPQ